MTTPDTYHQAGLRRGTVTSNFYASRDNLLFRGSTPLSIALGAFDAAHALLEVEGNASNVNIDSVRPTDDGVGVEPHRPS